MRSKRCSAYRTGQHSPTATDLQKSFVQRPNLMQNGSRLRATNQCHSACHAVLLFFLLFLLLLSVPEALGLHCCGHGCCVRQVALHVADPGGSWQAALEATLLLLHGHGAPG